MKILSSIICGISFVSLVLGCLSLSLNSLEAYPTILLFVLSLSFFSLFIMVRQKTKKNKWIILAFCIAAAVFAIVHMILPEYLWGFELNAIVHRSFISALMLISLALPAMIYSLFYFLGATPKAQDISRYPLIVFPVLLILFVYGLLIFQVFMNGSQHFNWTILTNAFKGHNWVEIIWKNGWPVRISHNVLQAGMLNHILGTLLLMGMTSIISLIVGIGVGIYVSEYSRGWFAQTIRFSTQILRAISIFSLAITAYNFVSSMRGTFLSDIICGYYYDEIGTKHIAGGSFLTASLFLSLLVIPIIANATEEGIRSLPKDISEGSFALGASREYALSHVLLPWSMPNIITGLILGCAEAAGSLTVILFLAGTGEYGVGPFRGVTSLTYFIFNSQFGRTLGNAQFFNVDSQYQYMAAIILLIITIGLTIGALVLKRKVSRRYKGA
jgi:phosphate transport system permease protein